MRIISALSSDDRLLKAARILWVVYAAGLLILFLASLPGYFERVSAGTVPDISFDIDQPPGNEYFTSRIAASGLSTGGWLAANVTTSILIVAVHYAVAGLIFLRLPRSGFGLLSAYVILLTGSSVMDDAGQVAGLLANTNPWLQFLYQLGALVWPLFPVWLYLFPDGRAVPRWVRWPMAVSMSIFFAFMVVGILDAIGLLPPAIWQGIAAVNQRYSLILFLVLPGILLALASQIYRYWRVSGPSERQQTKWFLFGLALFVAGFVPPSLPIASRLDAINGSITLMIFPITIGIALLRFRLWDIDVVVRRTAGYAVLTVMLALVYFGSIVVLQRLLAPLTGDSTLATILSTLLIAALVLPLRRRVQDAIDRRFFRRKYDAAKVLEGFAATARDETDLEQLTTELLRVIRETMEPEHVSIWLKPIEDHRPMTADRKFDAPQEPHVHNS